MSQPVEFWIFIAANLFVLGVGIAMTYLSYQAYRRMEKKALRYTVLGFGTITLGTLMDAIYEIGIKGSHELTGRELLVLHTVQSLTIGIGLAVIFYSLNRY